jgi:hypothetical protein
VTYPDHQIPEPCAARGVESTAELHPTYVPCASDQA